MGIQKWGLLGGFQNKVGPAIGHWTNGQNVIFPLPHPSTKPATVPQLNFRAKFGLVVGFQRLIGSLIKVGFQNAHKEKQSPFNAAFVHNYHYAVTGTTAENFTINYAEFMYSKGILLLPVVTGMATTEDAQLDLTWDFDVLETDIDGTDKATFVVYNPAKQRFVTRNGVVARSVKSYDMALPVNFSGDTVHVYMSFVSADGKLTSDSLYLGNTEVL